MQPAHQDIILSGLLQAIDLYNVIRLEGVTLAAEIFKDALLFSDPRRVM